MSNSKLVAAVLSVAFSVFFPAVGNADTELVLRKDFILKYKNRLTIQGDVTPKFFSKIHGRGTTGGDDGDIHISVLPGQEIGLPAVIEIQNARDAQPVIDRLKAARDASQSIQVIGVWRFWAEHGGDHRQQQGAPIPTYEHSNPDHVFEIHPVTSVGSTPLLSTLVPIEGFTAPDKRANDAFHRYENLSSQIKVVKPKSGQKKKKGNAGTGDAIQIRMASAGYNYVKFRMRLLDTRGYEVATNQWRQPDDGMFVFAEIFDPDDDDEPLVRRRRLGFVKDSAPYNKLRGMEVGQCMLVLGIPRLNLELVAWRLGLGVTKPHSSDVLSWKVPYEMVIVAVYDDAPARCGPDAE